MHHFHYADGVLHCENVAIEAIADRVGTPFYLYSHATLTRHYAGFDRAFDGMDRLICYSAKANSSQAILRLFAGLGSGLDIVSGGELFRGLKAGFDPAAIVYSGVGKTAAEIDKALDHGISMFNLESRQELDLIAARAALKGRRAPIAVRVNPDVDSGTHPYIATGLKANKFGLAPEAALELYRAAARMPHVEVVGIDCHIGSQITEAAPFQDALGRLREMVAQLEGEGIGIRVMDIGGGLGITYRDEHPPTPADYAAAIREGLVGLDLRLVLEPGRVLVGNAGVLVTRALFRKEGGHKRFLIVDAGMNDLLRPSLYDAFHEVLPVREAAGRRRIVADVVGPVCESGDFLARERDMPDAVPGDLLAVMSAGAYGFAMASNYCSRPRAAEVMARDDRFAVIRRRQTYDDLIDGESIPDFL